MCLIAYLPNEEADFTTENFRAAWENNGDGFGVMFPYDGRLMVQKEIGPYRKQKKLFRHVKRLGVPFAMHLRYKTHGLIDLENTHPYKILDKETHGRDLWMMHNGVLSVPEYDKSMSDTWHLIKYYLKPIVEANPDIVFDTHFRNMVEDFIGSSNKLLMMDDQGRTVIFNEIQGSYQNGTWLSNTYSLVSSRWKRYGGWGWDEDDWNSYAKYKYGIGTTSQTQHCLLDEKDVPSGRKFYDCTTGTEGVKLIEDHFTRLNKDDDLPQGVGVSVWEDPEGVAEILSACTDSDIEQWVYEETVEAAELMVYMLRNYFFSSSKRAAV